MLIVSRSNTNYTILEMSDKDECKDALLKLSTELASVKTKLEFLEKENERLKYK